MHISRLLARSFFYECRHVLGREHLERLLAVTATPSEIALISRLHSS